MQELPKTYNPREIEPSIYDLWMQSGHFHAEVDASKKPYTIVIPPPNVTGSLHLGHAFDNTLQDALIRHKRMQGYNTLWMPGTDHAGIATQIKVEEMLRERGESRFDHGREAFIEIVWDWKRKYGSRIIEQLKTLGSSCDWERERFTMDEGLSKAVREVFVRLYDKGLIYRGNRIINWCPECATALSDTEVDHEERQGHLWHIKYPIDGGGFITVATTRPETMLGDAAVVVHPDDGRYKALIGKTVMLPLMDRPIPMIADDSIDMSFGTGAVKVTPSHDPNDFEIAKKHGLPELLILDGKAAINENGGKYQGLDRFEARKRIVADLEALGLLAKIEEHTHSAGQCGRCETVIEPMASLQWFVKMEPLAKPAAQAVRDGSVKFVPDRFSKIYLNWMDNVRDWCISRQLWWGHPIPAFTCDGCGHMAVTREDPVACPQCQCTELTGDPDVLDTWFSSALWPFSTLGWPDDTPEFKYFYPTDVLVTGYDIIFFWVARMVFSGLEHTGQVPFRTVFMHGLIRDPEGRKMSKSMGNGVDPLELIEEFGADALRLCLSTGIAPGSDTRFSREKCAAMRNFCNKLWNASRFVLMNMDKPHPAIGTYSMENGWIMAKCQRLIAEVTGHFEKYDLGIAAQKIYDFLWDDYCDWYIELCKPQLTGGDAAAAETARSVLLYVLSRTIQLLHPFAPFITEAIWQALKPFTGDTEDLIASPWPDDPIMGGCLELEADMERVIELIRAIRTRRGDLNVPAGKRCAITLVTPEPALFERGRAFITKLAYASELTITETVPGDLAGMVQAVTADARALLPLAELVDFDAERTRLTQEIAATEAELSKLTTKLSNAGFVNKAPAGVVAAEREKAAALATKLPALRESLAALGA